MDPVSTLHVKFGITSYSFKMYVRLENFLIGLILLSEIVHTIML